MKPILLEISDATSWDLYVLLFLFAMSLVGIGTTIVYLFKLIGYINHKFRINNNQR